MERLHRWFPDGRPLAEEDNALELTSVQMGRTTKSAQIGSKCSTINSRPSRAQAEQCL